MKSKKDLFIEKIGTYIESESDRTPDIYNLEHEDLIQLYDYFINNKIYKKVLKNNDFKSLLNGIDIAYKFDLIEPITESEILFKYAAKNGLERIAYTYLLYIFL